MTVETRGKTEIQNEFVALRAKGLSYRAIASKLNISVNTVRAWEKELAAKIADIRAEELDELYTGYYMLKEARITQLGNILAKVTAELSQRKFTDVPTDKLVDMNVRLITELKDELAEPQRYNSDTKLNAEGVVNEFLSLLHRVRNGEVTKEMAAKESVILANLLKAYENSNLEQKIQALESVIKGRQ